MEEGRAMDFGGALKPLRWMAMVGLLCLAALGAAAGEVPASLQTIEGAAEDLLDLVDSRPQKPDWAAAARNVKKIEEAWKIFDQDKSTRLTSPRLIHGMERALVALKKASGLKASPIKLKEAANAVGAYCADLFELYDPKIPADLNRLDVMENQILIDLVANRPNLAAELTSVHKIWGKAGLKVKVRPGGARLAIEFEEELKAQEQALKRKDWKGLERLCRRELEVIDRMERIF